VDTLNSAAFNVSGRATRDCHYRIKKKDAPFRSSSRSEECGTSCFSGQVKNLFTSTAYPAWLDKNVCENGWIKKVKGLQI